MRDTDHDGTVVDEHDPVAATTKRANKALTWLVVANVLTLAGLIAIGLIALNASENAQQASRDTRAVVQRLDAAVQDLTTLQEANRETLQRIQASRYEASLRACRNQVRVGRDNVRFLRRLGVRDERVLAAARDVYRVERDCREYATRQTQVPRAGTQP